MKTTILKHNQYIATVKVQFLQFATGCYYYDFLVDDDDHNDSETYTDFLYNTLNLLLHNEIKCSYEILNISVYDRTQNEKYTVYDIENDD